jgi:hydroxymethylpyrimidine/phosphomethylpyrimidine kinase
VITCLTAQNPKRVRAVKPASASFVKEQLNAVSEELPPQAIKTGMLFSPEIIVIVADFLSGLRPRVPLIVDPVMVATSGGQLLRKDAVQILRGNLLPLATLITPNVPESEILSGLRILEPEDLRVAARRLHNEFACAVLLKGGHLSNVDSAIDVFYDGKTELLLSAPFVRGVSTHGTGCTYSAAIAAYCAHGRRLPEAVRLAKDYISTAISNSRRVGKHDVLGFGKA